MNPTTEVVSPLLADEDDALRRQLNRLRFAPPLEADFRTHYEASSLTPRLLLTVMSIIAVALTPLYDRWLLHPPADFVPMSRVIQFGIEIPCLLLSLLFALPRLRSWYPAAMVIGTLGVAGGLYAQRALGASYGYHVPFDFAATAIAAVFTLARLRFFVFLPWAAFIVVAIGTAEMWVFGVRSASFYNGLSLTILFLLLSTAGYLLERTARENWYRRRQLSMLALHDPLTGLPNRRHFDFTLTQLLRAAARARGNVALMIIDIDDFKSYNDHYGHPAGDACLRRIAQWLGTQMRRPQDFCARIGGEEFVAVWYDAKPVDARRMAEQLRVGIGNLGIPHQSRHGTQMVTASGGFVEVIAPHPEEAARSIGKQMLRRADDLLYQAKDGGRDRLVS